MQPQQTEHAALSLPRRRGILLHISSLPSKYGIGTYGMAAYRFADMLSEAGANLWALLPMGPSGFGDSPYQSFSSFALNPYFLDLELLCDKGLLTREECESAAFGKDPSRCDYGALYRERLPLLTTAFARAMQQKGFYGRIRRFAAEHPYVKEYALFTAIKESQGGKPWYEWPRELKLRDKAALADARKKADTSYCLHIFLQMELFEQWEALRAYARSRGVAIMGDMPIYCAYDSADCWAHPDCFMLDENMRPTLVAGVPPDYFSPKGQLWGNPLYNWPNIRRSRYKFWLDRMSAAAELYDVLRIDHFRGFAGYYSVPADAEDAVNGEWLRGCGFELFKRFAALQKQGRAENCEVVAEDLGFITPDVKRLLTRTGFAGMQVLEFAFGGGRGNPHKNKKWDGVPEHLKNKVCYTGTHDNPPLAAWWQEIGREERMRALRYAGLTLKKDRGLMLNIVGDNDCSRCPEDMAAECEFRDKSEKRRCELAAWHLSRAAVRCNARIAIVPMQDVLCLGAEARMNTPGTGEGNWQWRMTEEQLPQAEHAMNELFGNE